MRLSTRQPESARLQRAKSPGKTRRHLLFIFNVVNDILFSLLALRSRCRVHLRGGGSVTLGAQPDVIPVTVRGLAVGRPLIGLQLSISPFRGATHLALGGHYLSFGSARHIFEAGLEPGPDADVPAVHQLINLGRHKDGIFKRLSSC